MYVIHYTGIFQEGYVKYALLEIGRTVPIKTQDEAIKFASKFRFKFIADLLCRLHNWDAETNFTLKTFKVQKF